MATARTDQPPTYEEALAQLKDIQNQGISPDAKAKCEEAIANKLASSDTKQSILEEVQELANSAVEVDEAFQRVSVGLGRVDEMGFKDSEGKELEKLRPKWDVLHGEYTTLLWSSRDTATRTETYLLDFIEVILPGVQDAVDSPSNKEALESAKADLDEFIKRTNPDQGIVDGADAQGHSQAFTNLRRKIDEFKGKFDDFTKKQKEDINVEVTRLGGDIDVLKLKIQKTDTIITGLAIALGLTVFGTIVGATAALAATGPLAPFALVAVLIIGIVAAIGELAGLIIYIKERNGLQAEVDEKTRQVKGLQDKLELLQGIQAGLQAQEKDIDYIAGRLDQFAHIWNLASHDAKEIRDIMKKMAHSASASALRRRLNLLKNTYEPLKDALRLYATHISKSDATKR